MSADLGRGLALLAVGVIGALIAQVMRFPAGAIIGPLLACGLYRLSGGEPGPWRSAGRISWGQGWDRSPGAFDK